jgi:hypothetical protein
MERNLKVVHAAGTPRKQGHAQELISCKLLILKGKSGLCTRMVEAYLLLLSLKYDIRRIGLNKATRKNTFSKPFVALRKTSEKKLDVMAF